MKFKVRDSLSYGKENAIPSKTLAEVLGFRSVRDLQKAVEAERAAGAVILCDSQGAGYYLSDDPDELYRFTRTLNAIQSGLQNQHKGHWTPPPDRPGLKKCR